MAYAKGLKGVVAGETAISDVLGEAGRLCYRGVDIEHIVEREYAEVVWLVLFGDWPSAEQTKEMAVVLNGRLSAAELDILNALDVSLHPMQMLQVMIPLLSTEQSIPGMEPEAARGLGLIGKLPALVAAWRARETGQRLQIVEPTEMLVDYLTMFTGSRPSPEVVNVLKVIQLLQMEHSFNASTFAARVVASTLAPVESVLAAAVGSLFGRLHGGADEAALLDAIKAGDASHAAAFVDEVLAEPGGRLMGIGHREYRVIDPRAVVLKPLAKSLCVEGEPLRIYGILEAIEQACNARMAARGKSVWANVDFYKGPAYMAMGIPGHYFTAMFAMSRAVGWLAHFMEQREDNRIYRPKAIYTGKAASL